MSSQWKPFAQRVAEMTTGKQPFRKKVRRSRYLLHRWFFGRPFPKLRLSHQLLGFFVLVVLVPLLLLSYSIYGINEKAVRKQVAQFTIHTAEAIYDQLRLEMNWQEEQARLAGQYWGVILESRSPKDQDARISQFFRYYNDYRAVAIYDAQGQRKQVFQSPLDTVDNAFSEKIEAIPQRIQFQLASHLKAGGKDPGRTYLIQVTVPGRMLGNDKSIGALVFDKQFPYVEQLMDEGARTFHHGFVLVDSAGIIIAGPSQLIDQQLPKADLALYRSLKEGVVEEQSTRSLAYGLSKNSTAEESETELEKVFIKVPRWGWGMIIESPYSIQRHFIERARAQTVGLVILCIVLIIVLGLLYSRGINRNFRQLIKGIKALAEGRYSRKIRLITKSWTPFEIIYLTAEFNRMATKISTAWSSIQKLNQELVYKNEQDVFMTQATQRLHSSLELETVCKTATQLLTQRPDIGGAMVFLLQPESGRLELAAQTVRRLEQMPEAKPLTLAETELLSRAFADPALVEPCTEAQLSFLPPHTTATVQPMFYQEHPLGLLVLIKPLHPEKQLPAFDDCLVMEMMTNQIGIAIHQARQWEQLQAANKQLSKLDELKSNLIDTVSHELRTPLTNIKGYTSRLIRYADTLDRDAQIKSLKIVKQQADRLGRLVEDLLVIPDLERKEGIRVFPDRVDLCDLMHRSLLFVQEKANREVRFTAPDDPLDVLVDPDRMEQVVLNLLDNAIKYSYEDSVIEVSVHATSGHMVQVQVFNRCDAISPEELAQLFTKFKRLDERLTRTTRGTGLGLFITKGLVEAMGGTIWLEGDQGFRVYVEVPLFESREPSATEPESKFVSTTV